jgi:benzaldehyde dehydrogenase (NAD)
MSESRQPAGTWADGLYGETWRREPGPGTAPVIDKASGAVLGHIKEATAADVAVAAAAAHKAQREWAEVPGPTRGDVLREFSRLIAKYGPEISEMIVRETGSIGPKGQWEVDVAVREVIEGAALGSQPSSLVTACEDPGRENVARRIPVGVVGVITPWNSPFALAVRALAPALTLGNAVLLKPDPQTPVCGGVMLAALLAEAGLPDGLLQVLPGGLATGEAVVTDPHVEMVSFTGSPRGGRAVGAAAGGLLKRVSLELGGNNPFVVLEDTDIDAAASAGAWGSFFHQGQICMTTGRHIVHESIADAYTENLVNRARKLVLGDPYTDQVHLGPIINERQALNVDRVVAETIAQGATLRTGGSRKGLYFEPTVLSGVRPGMPAFDEEIFGPVAAITTFSTDDEAVALANNTSYGLVASVASGDLARAQRIARRLRVGQVHVNDQTVIHDVFGPIGGLGVSGNGYNYGAVTNADQFTEWQWSTTRTQIPAYPF